MSLKLILYSAITIFFNGAVLRRYLKHELLLTGPYTLLVLLPTVTQPICQLVFGGFFGITLFAIASYQIYKRLPQQYIDEDGKYVFISGCDSGFGFATAKALDASGVNVIAGCLFKGKGGEQDLGRECSDRLVTVQLDVTSEESIQNAVKEVKERLKGGDLWALVNNAGVMYNAEFEIMSLKFFRRMMDVNFFGAVRLTQAFLPLLRGSKGRVVTVCSVASEVPFQLCSAYCATKAALKIAMDTLRLEMAKWGVTVAMIHPFGYMTGFLQRERLEKNIAEIFDDMDPALLTDYGPRYREATCGMIPDPGALPSDLSPVVNCIEHALFAKRPLTHYKDWILTEVVEWLVLVLPVGLSKYISNTFGYVIPASAIGKQSAKDDGKKGECAPVEGGAVAETKVDGGETPQGSTG